MNKILIDRAVVEQALEALYASAPHDKVGDDDYQEAKWYELYGARRALRAALEQPQVEQEPVAWMTEDGRIATDATKQRGMASTSRPNFNIPLYLHSQPPRRPPLPDEQIDFMFANAGTGEYLAERERIRHLEIYSFGVRDAEAAHGIKD